MALPQTKASSLHDRLLVAVKRGTPLTPLEVKIFERDISEIRKIKPAAGLMLEGILNAILRKENECFSAHKRSILAEPYHPDVRCNYAISLKKFFRYEEALEQFEIAFSHSPRSSTALQSLINTILLTGHLEKVEEIVRTCKEKSFDLNFVELPIVQAAIEYAETANRLKISVKEIQLVSSKAADIAARRQLELCSFTQRQGQFGDRGMLHVVYGVCADGRTLFEMNEELHDFIAEDLTLESWDKLSISFRSFVEDDKMIARS